LDKKLVNRFCMQSLKVYANASNAYVYAPNWEFWDPQNQGPTPRVLSLGINATF